MRRRCRSSPAADPIRPQLFLDRDNRLGVLQPAHQPRILPFDLRQLRRHRITQHGLRSSFDRRQAAKRTSVAQSAPITQGRGIQAFAAQDDGGAAGGGAIDLGQNSQLVGERPSARPVRQFGSSCRWGCHGGRPPASHRVSPSGTIRLRVSVRHNHVISVLRPEAKLFGIRCLMIIGTEGCVRWIPALAPVRCPRFNSRDWRYRLRQEAPIRRRPPPSLGSF
jgi:hypothetical protein